jgi:hypothetical protein
MILISMDRTMVTLNLPPVTSAVIVMILEICRHFRKNERCLRLFLQGQREDAIKDHVSVKYVGLY